MSLDDLTKAIAESPRFMAGVYGSCVAMFLVKDTWPRRLAFGVVSLPSAYYGSILMSHWFGAAEGTEGVYGFGAGVFAVAIMRRLFVAVEAMDAGSLLHKIVDRFFGASK